MVAVEYNLRHSAFLYMGSDMMSVQPSYNRSPRHSRVNTDFEWCPQDKGLEGGLISHSSVLTS